jgi:uncharacterized FAD-dependent dehydrogenase
MKYLLRNLKIPVSAHPDLVSAISKKLSIPKSMLIRFEVTRKALDTRKKYQPFFDFTILLELDTSRPDHPDLQPYNLPIVPLSLPVPQSDPHPFIIGTGPAGLFCALAMVGNGLQPYLFEMGDALDDRAGKVKEFWENGKLDTQSNVQSGEGGGGTFSDGKLTSRSTNYYINQVHELLIRFGAPAHIAFDALPHLGTDGIRQVVRNIRSYLLGQGCRFHYQHQLEDITIAGGKVTSAVINGESHQPQTLIIAPGNAARATFRMLAHRGLTVTGKAFSVGFRIAHPQSWIDKSIYGSEKWSDLLGAASYRLTAPHAGKGTYTFCMCPGGYIVNAASEARANVTNGMSFANRANHWGNSAIVTSITEQDFGLGALDGLAYQERIEQAAFLENYALPSCRVTDYLQGRISQLIPASCLLGNAVPADIAVLFTAEQNIAFRSALQRFDRILPGFIKEGIIIAPETRTSSPVRFEREATHLNCNDLYNLYIIGEGGGYAGGIISSAADGYKIGSKFTL